MTSPDTFQRVINSKKRNGDFKGLRRYLHKLLSEMPDDYYLLAELSSACYQLGKQREALAYAQKSYQLAPEDYWVRYIYGCALLANDKPDDAAGMFDSIIACDADYLAHYEHGEGKRWAVSLLNDSRYMRAVVYQHEAYNLEARDLFLSHKKLRRRGIYSDFTLRQVNSHLRELNVIVGDSEQDYSISKYRPQFYNVQGWYTRNEWAAISDIGKTFDDGVLSAEEYLETEKHYIDTAIELARLSGCTYLTVDYLEEGTKDDMQEMKKNPLNQHLLEAAKKIRQGLRIPVSDCADYLCLCLRECCWAIFTNHSHDFHLKFGYDFYMNIHTALPKPQVENIVAANHLYLRP